MPTFGIGGAKNTSYLYVLPTLRTAVSQVVRTGDDVLVQEDNAPRHMWKMGRVLEVYEPAWSSYPMEQRRRQVKLGLSREEDTSMNSGKTCAAALPNGAC